MVQLIIGVIHEKAVDTLWASPQWPYVQYWFIGGFRNTKQKPFKAIIMSLS